MSVDQARTALFNVDLDLAGNRDERIRILERAVKEALLREEESQRRRLVGAVADADVLYAKATRLEMEIRLEREKVGGQ